tara:strand:- start:1654 stop:1935 length:282 start_codon:yes stop_codon:yes gene_type:complete
VPREGVRVLVNHHVQLVLHVDRVPLDAVLDGVPHDVHVRNPERLGERDRRDFAFVLAQDHDRVQPAATAACVTQPPSTLHPRAMSQRSIASLP